MKQRSLFAAERAAPGSVDDAYVRKSLQRLLYMARAAERLPWSEARTASWEKLFGELARDLPDGEGEKLNADFQAELVRLRAAS